MRNDDDDDENKHNSEATNLFRSNESVLGFENLWSQCLGLNGRGARSFKAAMILQSESDTIARTSNYREKQ